MYEQLDAPLWIEEEARPVLRVPFQAFDTCLKLRYHSTFTHLFF